MFLKCSEIKSLGGKVYKNYKIVVSVRKEGKVKHKILFSLGSLTDEKAEQIRQVLLVNSSPNEMLVRIDDVIVEENIDFLDIYTFRLLWKEWGFDEVFKSLPFAERLVLNRCLKPKSKIAAAEWNRGCVLDYIPGNKDANNKYGVYADLENINKMEETIQQHIARTMIKNEVDDLNAVVYDITSTYFEDTQCTIALRGYSRDKRPDKLQIVIALAISSKGYPFYWKVYQGNTQDITTMQSFVDDVKSRFGIEKCLLVFDRGMVSEDNIKYMDDNGYEYITAIDKNEISGLDIIGLGVFSETDESNINDKLQGYSIYNDSLRFKEFCIDKKRYIIGFSLERKEEERYSRTEKIKKFEADIETMNQKLLDAKRSRNLDKAKVRVNGLIKKYKMTRMVDVQYEEVLVARGENELKTFKVIAKVSEYELSKAVLLDGVTCFYTNTSVEKVSAKRTIQHYREKNKVEESFHEIKSHIRIRPIFVSRTGRVCAHVTICILAYLLMNTLEERLDGKGINMSLDGILEELGRCKINIISSKDNVLKRATITKMSDSQSTILRHLGYKNVTGLKEVKSIIKSLNAV